MSKISLINAGKRMGKTQIIHGLNMEISISPSKMYGFIGPNGSGKTTTMKLISGLYFPNQGKIACENTSLEYDKWAKANVAYIPAGERGLFFKNSVYDNAMYYGIIKGASPTEIKKNIALFSKSLKITNLLDKRVEQLSTGQKKKAQLLCAISTGKKLLLLDEPSLGLDMDSSIELQSLLTEVFKTLNTSIFISSHDVNFLSGIVDNYYFIFDGTIKSSFSTFYDTKQLEKEYYRLKEESLNEGSL